MLLLLSEDISFNQGPINGSRQHNYDQWDVSKNRGLRFVHTNINSLLPKIDELPYIAKLSEANQNWMIQSYVLKVNLKIMI